jgi:hypothetical protein
MNGLDFAYFHFRVERIQSGKCISLGPRCLVCDLAWEGWPHPTQGLCKHENGSGIMDTNGNGEYGCHECGHVEKIGRGLQPQPS